MKLILKIGLLNPHRKQLLHYRDLCVVVLTLHQYRAFCPLIHALSRFLLRATHFHYHHGVGLGLHCLSKLYLLHGSDLSLQTLHLLLQGLVGGLLLVIARGQVLLVRLHLRQLAPRFVQLVSQRRRLAVAQVALHRLTLELNIVILRFVRLSFEKY